MKARCMGERQTARAFFTGTTMLSSFAFATRNS